MLKINERAPDFTLPSTNGRNFNLYSDQAGKPCILYFYPKDFTPGCTKEAIDFKEHFDFFKNFQIDIYGISRDPIQTHLEFKKSYNLPFDLLSDEKGKVAELYKATVPLINFTKRITYLLDKRQKIIAAYENMFASGNHIKIMKEKIEEQNS